MNSEFLGNEIDAVELITLPTPGLGNRSYLVVADGVAVGIDVQRDLDRVREILEARGLTLSAVVETHIHNDYVTGGYALAREHGARYVVPAGPRLDFDCLRGEDDASIDVGPLSLQVIASPGHTDAHATYAVHVPGAQPLAAFTGGSLLLGGAGRTDLLGAERTVELAREQYWSARRLSRRIPPEARILPTHGFGSFCLAGSAVESPGDTLADQMAVNPAFLLDEDGFVANLVAGLGPVPAYFPQMAPRNASGPEAGDLSPAPELDATAVADALATGRPVVDVRARQEFAQSHCAGTLSIDGSAALATWHGWVVGIDEPPVLIGDNAEQLASAQRELVRIGVDRLAGTARWNSLVSSISGMASGVDPTPASPALTFTSTRTATFEDLGRAVAGDGVSLILDVRAPGEWRAGHIVGSVNVPTHVLASSLADGLELGDDAWVHCAAGFRAAIAVSLIEQAGLSATLIDDAVARAQQVLPWCSAVECDGGMCSGLGVADVQAEPRDLSAGHAPAL